MEEKKKKTTTKKNESKTTKVEKKEVKKVEKSVIPNPEPASTKTKSFISSYAFLYTTFGLLFVIVIVLGIMVYIKSGEPAEHKGDIVFSIMEKDTNNYLDMELSSLVGKEYVLKVTNFRKNKLNKDGATYKITVTNGSEAEIEILKNDSGKNLMTNQEQTVIEGEKLSTKDRESIAYYFRIKNEDKVKKGDVMRIEVAS